MRKQIIPSTHPNPESQNSSSSNLALPEGGWLPLEQLAVVEITSEEAEHPVESALLPTEGIKTNDEGRGWRAAEPGEQLLRLRFDEPQSLRRIRLRFTETDTERTQEFVLRYSRDHGASFQEIVRQQWTFSPQGSTQEVEEYQVDLRGVTTLELAITPHISGGDARASLAELRLA